MTERTNAHRCTPCDVNWPWTRTFAEACPICHQETWPAREKPLTLDEARMLQRDVETARERRATFDAYYRGHAPETCSMCGESCTIIVAPELDGRYSLCPACDQPDAAATLDSLGGWDDGLFGELPDAYPPGDPRDELEGS